VSAVRWVFAIGMISKSGRRVSWHFISLLAHFPPLPRDLWTSRQTLRLTSRSHDDGTTAEEVRRINLMRIL